jgi:hypothetical protein
METQITDKLTIEAMMEMATNQVRRIIEEDGQEATNMFIAESTDNSLNIIAAPWNGAEERDFILNRLRALFKERNMSVDMSMSARHGYHQMSRPIRPVSCLPRTPSGKRSCMFAGSSTAG